MGLFEWAESAIRTFTWYDIGLLKLAMVAFTLMLVAWWPVIATLQWWVYAIIFIACCLPLMAKLFSR